MIRVTWTADTYPPDGPPLCGRYVRQRTCAAADLLDDVRALAVERRREGCFPFYVDWSLP